MKKLYLPNLKRIKINEYTLYQQEPTFEFDFQIGTNAVIGANGVLKQDRQRTVNNHAKQKHQMANHNYHRAFHQKHIAKRAAHAAGEKH